MVSDQRLREAAVKLRGMSATAEPWINQVVAERLAVLLEAIERLPQPLHVDVLQVVVDARYLARAVNACEECRNHWTTWHYAGDLRAAGLIDDPGTVPCVMPACDGRDAGQVAADQQDLREAVKSQAMPCPPKAEVVEAPGFNRVYGWTKELVTDRGAIPLSELISIHSFAWTARRAMRKWLREAQG